MSDIINMIVVLDVDRLMRDYPNPSQDQNHPTGIVHNYAYMVVSNNKEISGEGTGDLNFSAGVGDRVRVHGISEYANFEKSILIYNMDRFQGDQVFGEFTSTTYTKKTAKPSGPNVLPAEISNLDFWFFESNVKKTGTEGYYVKFAVYIDTVLKGYFYWDPTITVTD